MVVLDSDTDTRTLKESMNARVVGSGKNTLILAHGYGGEQSSWDSIVPYLAQRYRVVVFDWKFSAAAKDHNTFDLVKYSSLDAFAKDLIGLVEELELGPSVFIGHSMAGMIGCLASIERGDLFKKLILIGASPRYMNTDGYEGGFEKEQIDEIILNIGSNFHVWATNFAPLVVDATDLTSVEKFRKSLSRMNPEVALSIAKIIFYGDNRDCLDKVQTPCTIIQTTDDIVVPNSVAYYMQKKIREKTTLEMIEDNGHFPHLTKTKELVDVLDRVMSLDCEDRNNRVRC